jgi:HlyD family secretion protein
MSKRKKLWILCGLALILAGVIFAIIKLNTKSAVFVQTSIAQRKDVLVSKVSASGEIRAKKFIALQSEITGIITELPVREGNTVKKGDVLLRIDPIQTAADQSAKSANYEAQLADVRSQEFSINSAEAGLLRDESTLSSMRAKLDLTENDLAREQSRFKRQQQLNEEGLISREDYEIAQNNLKAAKSRVLQAKADVTNYETQIRVAKNNIEQSKTSAAASLSRAKSAMASLTQANDSLKKTTLYSPLDGVITQLKKEKGERAVPGMLSNPEATIMTIADLSVIQAEIKVDETDVVNLALGNPAQVKVEALPDVSFEGEVTEIGNSPIQAAGSTQEAKDFKVIITLKIPSNKLRPGMSCTGEITTQTRKNALVIPIQALTVRDVEVDKDGKYIQPDLKKKSADVVRAASSKENVQKKELEGVFEIDNNKVARFRPIRTGITGESEIEVLDNLKDGTEIISGSFQILRTIKDGTPVRTDRTGKFQPAGKPRVSAVS